MFDYIKYIPYLCSGNNEHSKQTQSIPDEKIVKVCGTPFGVKMFTDGVLVVDFSKINTEKGYRCPAKEAGLLESDLIIEIDGIPVFRNEDVAEIIENCGGKTLDF